MPKSIKTAPPQQASLQEMWGKKKERNKTNVEPITEPELESDVDQAEDLKGIVLIKRNIYAFVHLIPIADSVKRKQPITSMICTLLNAVACAP